MTQMPENADQNNSEYGKFLRIVFLHTFENPVGNGNQKSQNLSAKTSQFPSSQFEKMFYQFSNFQGS